MNKTLSLDSAKVLRQLLTQVRKEKSRGFTPPTQTVKSFRIKKTCGSLRSSNDLASGKTSIHGALRVCGLTLQPADAAGGAAAELIDLQPHALGEGDEEVGERGVVVRIMRGVGAVFVAAAGEEDG